MPRKKLARSLTVLTALVIAIVCVASAQITRGSIIGFVTDSSGSAISGATITAANVDTGFSHKVMTQEDGSYRALLLPTGRYKSGSRAER